MEGQTLIFTNSAFAPPPTPFYASYNTPPYTLNYGTWPEVVYQPLSMNEDVLQMQQQLRFPTPPITPPRAEQTGPQTVQEPQQQQQPQSSETQQKTPQRTQSVIMKVGHDQSPQHISADLPYVSLSEENKLTNHHHHHQHDHHQHQQQQHQQHNDTPSSGTSSPTSHNDFICDWIDCGRYFESLELLAHHVTLIHAVASLTDGLYYCRWTGCQRTERGFNARYKMLVHVRTHTKEKPHQCHLCDKRFSRAENLKIHIRSHSGEKPYICTFEGCNKAYSNSSDRFKHTRTHSMEKPYMCKVPGCLKRYTDPSSLRKHVKTFKHSVQIMDSKATVHHPATLNNIEESRYSLLEQNHKYPSYLVMPAAPLATNTQDSFCMAMEEMCHIKATLNCYSTNSTPVDTESYWLQESETDTTPSPLYHPTYHHNHHPTTYQHGSDYADVELDLTTDKPLDLRVNRC